MRTFRRYKIWIFALFFALSFLIFLPERTVSLAADDAASVDGTSYATLSEALEHWTDNTTLTLLRDCVTQETITVETRAIDGSKTLNLGGHTLSLAAGKTGSVLRVENDLTLCGEDKSEIKGGSSVRGGGIYVAAHLSLRGSVIVANNTDSNIYLTRGNKIDAQGFTGRAGVTVLSLDEPFAEGSTDTFFSDNLAYRASENGGVWRLYLSPLASIIAQINGSPRIFPKTDINDLKQYLTVTGINENGVDYPAEILYTLSGELELGVSRIRVTVSEEIFVEFTVKVVVPRLISIEAEFVQTRTLFFDSNPALLYSDDLIVTGHYEDGLDRRIFPDPERTKENCGEEYIDDCYEVECDFSLHQSGIAAATVIATETGKTASFEVIISKHIVNTADINVADVTVLEGGNTPEATQFVPGLVKSIMPVVTRNGLEFNAESLPSGVYTVEISFVVLDDDNYELAGENLKGRLIVNRREFTKTGDKLSYIITREGGISPEWDFLVTETKDTTVLGDEYEVKTAYDITFLPGESSANPGEFTIKILLSDNLRGKEIKLFRLRADGEPVEVASERDGDYLVFKASGLVQTRFLLSTESSTRAYVVLAVCFGVASVLGAGALIWYFFFKRKLHKDQY